MTTDFALTDDQYDLICDAQDMDAQLADMSTQDAAMELAKRGVPEFASLLAPPAAPAAPEPKPERKPERPRRESRTSSPAQPSRSEQSSIPSLDTGTPAALQAPAGTALIERADGTVARIDPRPEPAATERQLPARRDEAKHLPAASQAGVVVGMETLDGDDFVIPQLRIKQSQTKDEHKLGISDVPDGDWFVSNDPSDHSEQREVVFLELRKGRSFMLPYEEENRERALEDLGLADVVPSGTGVVCSSLDRIYPEVRDGQTWPPQAVACKDCKHSKWTQSRSTGKGRPPACGETYRAIVVDRTDGGETPARLFLRSSAIKPAKALNTNLRMACRKHRDDQGRPLPTSAFSVQLGTREKDNGKGIFYVPTFSRPERLDDEDIVAYADMRAELVGVLDQPDHDDASAAGEED